VTETISDLGSGRRAYAAREWSGAYESLARADREAPLGADDLELLATSAYMRGRDAEHLAALERAHHAHLEAGATLRAARCALWVGMHLFVAGEMARANGWLGRARRLVDRAGGDCVERGYLLLPLVFQQAAAGDGGEAVATAASAASAGERFDDADLFALAVHEQGHLLVRQGEVERGLALLDEAMVAVTSGELSPIVSGLVYCGVILGCQEAHEVRRAREWTAALTRWCEQQHDMVAFTGRCLVHRAEILLLHGSWAEALDEASRAAGRCAEGGNDAAAGEALYLQGEVHRLRGHFARAEEAYRQANARGVEPQPGLALLRLAQGNDAAAATAIRRALGETAEPLRRARLLPACEEILLAAGYPDDARAAALELEQIATGLGAGLLGALAAGATGAVALGAGDPATALPALRRAVQLWRELEAPYEAARGRVLVALACRALGDDDAAALELDAARASFRDLRAAPDLAHADSLAPDARDDAHGLTARELQVLRLVAAGHTNRAIASELVLSERTVDRHVSNIFAKLGVGSRTAATAHAYEQKLV
jgi:DNA-binding NarL/FixJ family response regulator